MMPIQNLDPQLIAAKAGKSAPQGANKLAGEAPAMNGDFASLLMQEVATGEAKAAAVDGTQAAQAEILNAELVPQVEDEAVAHALNPQGGVQATPVTLEQLNWAMENPKAAPAATEPTPKLLDPSLIKQVNEVVIPQDASQVQAEPVQLQLKDLLMQQQQPTAAGRAPAIDFAKAEVDPQLMNFEDFVAQKNAVMGKPMANPQAYGMPAKNSLLVGEKAKDVKDLQWSVETAAPVTAGATVAQLEQPLYTIEAPVRSAQVDNGPAPRVFDMNQLKNVDTSNTDTVISQVTDYIVQAKASKEPTVHMKVQHQDLGMLDITVNRVQNDVVSIAIGTQDQGAKLFLGQHREQLMTHLTQAGVVVSDLRMEQSSNSTSNRENMGQQSQQGFQGQDRQFGSEQNQRRHDQQRRQDLWEVLREKEVA